MSDRIKVAVLMGGISTEHEISIKSGTNVANALPKNRFTTKPVVITREGYWKLHPGWLTGAETFSGNAETEPVVSAAEALDALLQQDTDVVFIALHGPGGEDGVIQGFFETAGIPYTGSGVLGNAVGMDKILTKKILIQEGITTPAFLERKSYLVKRDVDGFVDAIEAKLGFPCVPKINNQGSSRNMGIAESREELHEMLAEFAGAGSDILVEEFIRGTEVTCAVINRPGEESSYALPPTELVPVSSKFFDYEAKYTPGATNEITPARISPEQTLAVQDIAVRCHEAIRCYGMSRTDMIIRENRIYVLETNTIPGLTNTSLIPQAAAADGISFESLLEMQVMIALDRWKRNGWLKLK